ncbi:MAG: hypothetical protein NVSMB62_19520 [Acidobacteriaceae bacterium]
MNFNPTARAAAMWTQKTLTVANTEWLRELPRGPIFPGHTPGTPPIELAPATIPAHAHAGPHVGLAHGSPLDEDTYILSMRDAWAPLQQMQHAVTFVGHTHVQGGFWQRDHDWHEVRPGYRTRNEADTWRMDIVPGTRQIINPGSVGQPRDSDWRASFAIFDSTASEVVFHRVPYDVTTAQGRILMAGLPERLAARLREGR